MTKPLITIHNAETNEITQREMNDDEYAIYAQGEELSKQKQKDELLKKEALAKLAALGLTSDDLKALGLT